MSRYVTTEQNRLHRIEQLYNQTVAGLGLAVIGGLAAVGLIHTLSEDSPAAHRLGAQTEITTASIEAAQQEQALFAGKVAGEIFVAGVAGSIGGIILKRSLHELDILGG